ncbi:MAG: pyridoxal-phosphate dependent enzyme [Rhodospirillales bacterium]|nr:pyridoxal-phosphate dependent enzyme [Rhodospirillales bacterium]
MAPQTQKKPAAAKREPFRYISPATGKTYPLDKPLWRCPESKSHLNLTAGAGIGRGDIDTSRRSLWRYQAALPFDKAPTVTMGEGCTPLIRGRWQERPVLFKLEFLMPTGSFKDRGIAVMINYLKNCGITKIFNDSSGNGGASLAGYSAAASIACKILLPAYTSPPKIIQIAAYGSEVVPIKGTRNDVAEAALREAEKTFYASHNWQPLFLQGTKTLAYELWEDLGFKVPDNIVAPLGGGSNLIGCYLGFQELMAAGEIDRMPRIYGVQPAVVAPLYATFMSGKDKLVDVPSAHTLAEGIAMTRPVRVKEVMDVARTSKGGIVAVSEHEILMALRALARQGVFAEPTSAAAAAGLTKLQDAGTIKKDQTTVVVLTGSGLKATEYIGKAIEIETPKEH